MKPFYQQTTSELFQKFSSDEAGLAQSEAEHRLTQYGPNQLQEEKPKSLLIVFLEQFKDLLVLILIAAAVISWLSGNAESTLVIFAVILLNALLGTVQYQKAQKSLNSLKAMSAPHARVLRDGIRTDIPAVDIVPGDILLLEAGDIVSADVSTAFEPFIEISIAIIEFVFSISFHTVSPTILKPGVLTVLLPA